MGRKNSKKKGRPKRPPKQRQRQHPPSWTNFVPSAGPGCYIARRHCPVSDRWIVEWEDIDPETETETEGEGGEESECPDLTVDTEPPHTLTLCNVSPTSTKVAYVTVSKPTVVRGGDGRILPFGSTTTEEGVTRPCATFIVLCPPAVFVHLCYLDIPDGIEAADAVEIESDVQEWRRHPDPNDEHPRTVRFPLATDVDHGPYLCTQGEGGELTHFFDGNLHAVDFACPIGTPLVAVGDGVVSAAKVDHDRVTGICVSNLFRWNGILLRLDDGDDGDGHGLDRPATEPPSSSSPLYVEYVHVRTSLVEPGERVRCGQIVGTSGSVGFSPEPHLHFSAFRSADPQAPTVRVRFVGGSGDDNGGDDCGGGDGGRRGTFLPTAGNWYGADGRTDPPSTGKESNK